MPSAYSGTLTGSGTVHFVDYPGYTLTNMDTWITTLGPKIRMAGDDSRRTFKFVGWIQFFNDMFVEFTGQPPQAVTPPIYFNSESQIVITDNSNTGPATDFYYWIAPGCAVEVNVSH